MDSNFKDCKEPNYKAEYERNKQVIFHLKTENAELKRYIFTLLSILADFRNIRIGE